MITVCGIRHENRIGFQQTRLKRSHVDIGYPSVIEEFAWRTVVQEIQRVWKEI